MTDDRAERCTDCGTTPAERGQAAGAEWIAAVRRDRPLTAPDLTPLLADRETLADVIAAAIEGHRDGYEPADLPTEYHGYGYACADALLASAALPTPGQYVAGLADDETLVERVALHGLFRHEQVAKRESAQDRWDTTLSDDDQDEYRDLARAAIRALAAALTERTDRG